MASPSFITASFLLVSLILTFSIRTLVLARTLSEFKGQLLYTAPPMATFPTTSVPAPSTKIPYTPEEPEYPPSSSSPAFPPIMSTYCSTPPTVSFYEPASAPAPMCAYSTPLEMFPPTPAPAISSFGELPPMFPTEGPAASAPAPFYG